MTILIAGHPEIRVGQTWTRNRGRRYWVANDTLRRTYTLTQEA